MVSKPAQYGLATYGVDYYAGLTLPYSCAISIIAATGGIVVDLSQPLNPPQLSSFPYGAVAYQPNSQHLILATPIDANDIPIVGSTGVVNLSIFDTAGFYRVQNIGMTFDATLEAWTYVAAASMFPANSELIITVQTYDTSGVLLQDTTDLWCAPTVQAPAIFARESINTFTFPLFGPPNVPALSSTASAAQITIASSLNGHILQAATAMTYNTILGRWRYDAPAAIFTPGQALTVTCAGYDLALATLYRTSVLALTDSG